MPGGVVGNDLARINREEKYQLIPLNKIFRETISILNKREKYKLRILTGYDVFISLLDILFLAALLYLIRFYTEPRSSFQFTHYKIDENPVFPALLFLLAFGGKNILGFFVSKKEFDFVYQVASRISRDMLRSYLDSPYRDFVKVDSSVINRKISQQPIEFSHYVLNGFQQIFTQSVLIVITLMGITLYNPLLFPLLLLIMAPPILFIGLMLKKKLKSRLLMGKQASERSIQHLQEALSGYIESNTMGKNEFFTGRFDRFQSRLNTYLAERVALQNMPSRMIEVFAVLGLFLLISLNYIFSGQQQVPLVTIGALMISAYKIIPGVVRIINTASQIKTYAYSTEGLQVMAPDNRGSDIGEGIESLEFSNINFKYEDQKILNEFSGCMTKGDMTGLSGLSGKGKTSLINIFLGFLEQNSGEIKINGHICNSMIRRNFWPHISYVKQIPFFLHATIAVNISFQEKNYNQQKLLEVIEATGLTSFVASLGGMETMIMENGRNLSGGQRQRFALARALYRDFDLLILDEPFSELDRESEKRILEYLQYLSSIGKMILLISHSSESLEACHNIFKLDEN
jgi:ABC-type multidrug transport system fused ATPase/permease subunit